MSPNANYNRGTRFERELVNALKACGAYATRSAGSHGFWDVSAATCDMAVAVKVSKLFEWLSTQQPPKGYEWFDWVCRYGSGRLEKLCYVKVIHDNQGQWAYFIQLKVKS